MKDPFIEEYGKLVGKTVEKVVKDSQPESPSMQTYALKFTDGTVAWIDCDPEGNGPGFLHIEEKVKK